MGRDNLRNPNVNGRMIKKCVIKEGNLDGSV
jgi:hypothetical protein